MQKNMTFKNKRKTRLTKKFNNHYQNSFILKADRKLRKVFKEIGIPENVPFVPDDFQTEALEKIEKSDVLVSAPTGSGKTWIAAEAIKSILNEEKRAWYASPLKALSNSKYNEFENIFGAENVGLRADFTMLVHKRHDHWATRDKE